MIESGPCNFEIDTTFKYQVSKSHLPKKNEQIEQATQVKEVKRNSIVLRMLKTANLP